MNASKRILVYSKDRQIIDAVRAIASSLSCFFSTVDYKAAGTIDMDVVAFGHFARVFDADTFSSVEHDLQELVEEGLLFEQPTIVIGQLSDNSPRNIELFSHPQDPRLALRLHQALELWRMETGLNVGYAGAIAQYESLVDSVASEQSVVPLPLLIQVSERYRRARTRVMVFGDRSTGCTPIEPRETRTWLGLSYAGRVHHTRFESLWNYRLYVHARTSTQSRSTWAWVTSLGGIAETEGDGTIEPVWNDLTKIPVTTGSSIDEARVTEISRSLITVELAVLQPDVVLFMLDQTEEHKIVNAVSGAMLHDIHGVPPHLIRQVTGGGLPNASYRVCREDGLQFHDVRSNALSRQLDIEVGIDTP